jgi:acetyltransferase-like isoleucine patch superfamily enzyme
VRPIRNFLRKAFEKILAALNGDRSADSRTKLFAGAESWVNFRNVTVGESVSFGGEVLLYGTAPITVGAHTMIGYRVTVHTSTHDYHEHPMWRKRIDRPVHIGSHVWIGSGSIILPGVKLGDYSVVAAGAVVNKHVPKGAVVAGNPARITGYRDLTRILSRTHEVQPYPVGSVAIEESFLPDEDVCNPKE